MGARLMRGAVAVALLVVAAAAPPARAEARRPVGGKATGSLLGMPAVLDPLAVQSFGEVTLSSLLFDGLYRLDAAGRAVPQLAAGPPVLTPDGLRARIPLLKTVRFHDGRRLHPQDAVASLRRAQAARAWAAAPIQQAAVDGDAVLLTLARPATVEELTGLLATPQLAVTAAGRAPTARNANGTGPFRLKRLDAAGRRAELEAYVEHFAGRPYLDAITVRWFDDGEAEARQYEAGTAEISLHGAVAFQGNQPKFPTAALDGPATVLTYLGFGRAHAELLGDVEFRRAVSLSLSRTVLARIGGGERVVPAIAPESPDLGGAAPTAAEADAHVADAQAALRRAAARHPELAAALDRRAPLALELLVDRTRPDDFEVANRVVAALYPLGVSVTLARVAPGDFARRVAAGQCDLWVGQLLPPGPARAHEYAAAFAAGADAWAQAALARAPLDLAAAQAAFVARVPIVPLFHRVIRAHHRTVVHGLLFDAIGRIGLADAFLFPDAPAAPTEGDSP